MKFFRYTPLFGQVLNLPQTRCFRLINPVIRNLVPKTYLGLDCILYGFSTSVINPLKSLESLQVFCLIFNISLGLMAQETETMMRPVVEYLFSILVVCLGCIDDYISFWLFMVCRELQSATKCLETYLWLGSTLFLSYCSKFSPHRQNPLHPPSNVVKLKIFRHNQLSTLMGEGGWG